MPHKNTHYSIKSKIKFSVKYTFIKKKKNTTNIFSIKILCLLNCRGKLDFLYKDCVFFIKITVCTNYTLLWMELIYLIWEFFYFNVFTLYYNYYANEIVYVKTLGELFCEHSNDFHCWTIFLIFPTQWIPSKSVMCFCGANFERIHTWCV